MGDHAEAHVRVCDAAEFGALPVINTRLFGDEPEEVVVERHHVDLAGEFRYPEAMDNVLRRELHVDRTANRDVHLVGGHDFLVRVTELEPPAVTYGLDFEDVAHVGWRSPLLFPDADDGWHSNGGNHDGRKHRPSNFELGVAVNLLGDFVVAAAVSDRGVDDGAFDDDEDSDGDPEDQYEKIALVSCDGSAVAESGLRMLRRTSREDRSCGESQHNECELVEVGGSQPVLHLDAVLS